MTQLNDKSDSVPFLVRYNKAKNALHSMNIKKNGAVVYGKKNFEYFELKDIICAIDQVCETFNIAYTIDCQNCILILFDALDPNNHLEFKTYNYPGIATEAHTQQDPNKFEGGTNTYRRRYMLITAFNLEEPDGVEETVTTVTDSKRTNNWEHAPEMTTYAPEMTTIERISDEEFYKYLEQSRALIKAIRCCKHDDKEIFEKNCTLNIKYYKAKFLAPNATKEDKSSALHAIIKTYQEITKYLES